MSTLKCIWDCMFSPRLIKIYGQGPIEQLYQPTSLEKWGDTVIHSLYVIWKFGVYTSPFLAGILYTRGYFESESLLTLTKLVTSVGVILIVSFCCRGMCRAQNPVYMKFLMTLQNAENKLTPDVKKELNTYDFSFDAWPVEFNGTDKQREIQSITPDKISMNSNLIAYVFTIPYRIIAYCAINTFGIKIIYPGTFSFLQALLEQTLIQGRTRLVETYNGERFKLKTADSNEIDTMVIDRRNQTVNGNTLVICCEGNAGFYEIGIAITPIEAGYSVIGWNHPGFGGSTGRPFPSAEHNAIDTVVQFAINRLKFRIENIIFFGWSIGGYTSSWAAMNYVDCKGVIIDATFDDILPLATNYMPHWWEPIVKIAIREHVNLDVYSQLVKFPGPVSLIRRTEDEVICLREGDMSSNRGNDLLIKLLHHRYPCVVEQSQKYLLREYLSVTGASQDDFVRKLNVDETILQSLVQSYISEFTKSYPMKIGEEFTATEKNQMALFLARKYMKDFKSTHCINLPADLFQVPWDVNIEPDFVFT